jgi:RNA polymerase sigma-70 factor, ECF subfamily
VPSGMPPVTLREETAMTTVGGELSALVAAAQAGDRAALEHLLSHARPQIYRYVLARVVDRASAEDVTQEVTMAIVSALPRYVDTGRSPLAWMFGIAQNKMSEAHRSGGRRRETVVAQLPDRHDERSGPDITACELETARELAVLLDQLPQPQGEILRLRIAAGLSAEETAAVLGMTAGAVRIAQHRALNKLRAAVLKGGRHDVA